MGASRADRSSASCSPRACSSRPWPASWGVGLTYASLAALARLAPATLPRLADVRVDWTVAAFTVLLCVGTAVLFGLAPALHAAEPGGSEVLRSGGRVANAGPPGEDPERAHRGGDRPVARAAGGRRTAGAELPRAAARPARLRAFRRAHLPALASSRSVSGRAASASSSTRSSSAGSRRCPASPRRRAPTSFHSPAAARSSPTRTTRRPPAISRA